MEAGGGVIEAVAEFGERVGSRRGERGEVPGIGAVLVDELVFEAGGVVLPIGFGPAGFGGDAEEFGDAGEGGGPGLFGAGGGVGGGFVGGGLEEQAGDDHGEEEDEDEDGEEYEAATPAVGRRQGGRVGVGKRVPHGLRVGSGRVSGLALVSERAGSAARPEGMRMTRRKRS